MAGASSSIIMLVFLLALLFFFPIRKLFRAVIDWLNRH